MRIFTSVCCTAILLPISGLSAIASPLNSGSEISVSLAENSLEKPSENVLAKIDFLSQKQWLSEDYSLSYTVAQSVEDSTIKADSSWTNPDGVSNSEVEDIMFQLQDIQKRNFEPSRGAPSLTIANPYGYGADRGFYTGLSYQVDTRGGLAGENDGDATWGFGFGFGNAKKAVGAELSYTLASFGSNRSFGTGGFNAKIHRQIMPDWSIAAGWNSFLSLGDENDLEDSLYLATTKVFKTRSNLNSLLSRMAVSIGVGNGQFRTEDAIIDGNEGFNVFGSLAFRVAQPVSFVTEWTGQDLAMGLSVSPIKTLPVTINLGVRDIAGAGDGARFVVGIGTGF